MKPAMTRALGLVLGYAADRALGDPRRGHPVAAFGTTAARLERLTYADRRRNGVVHVAILVAGVVAGGVVAEHSRRARCPARRPRVLGRGGSVLAVAAAAWAVLGGNSLEREASAVRDLLVAADLPAARLRLTHLVGRDTEELTESEVARAVVESVAENTADAVVAPLLWGALAGLPGLLGYRAVNTLDAMIGHHNARYERFGWAAARLDDIVNLPAARLAGLAVLAARPARAAGAWHVWRRDAHRHPSPNAGVIEAAFAGSLGIRLGGTNRYHGSRIEHRAVMGEGRPAETGDIDAAVRLARRVDRIALTVAVLAIIAGGRR
jgi:adenosylcobinamide-phosphate synthase